MTSPRRDELRDGPIDRVLREYSRETPSAAIDDAILAAARRAVGARPHGKPAVAEAREPWRWWMPLAAAATIGAIAVGVIQTLPRDAGEPTVVSDSATASRPSTPAASRPDVAARIDVPAETARQAPAASSAERPKAAGSPRAARADATTVRPSAAPSAATGATSAESKATIAAEPRAADAPGAALAKRAENEADRSGKVEHEPAQGFVAAPPPAGAPPVAAPAAAPAPVAAAGLAAAPADAGVQADAAVPPAPSARAPVAPLSAAATRERVQGPAAAVKSPEAFVGEIRRLIAANDGEGAMRVLREFRRAHADADERLPAELRDWAKSVPR